MIPWAELVLPALRWDPERGFAPCRADAERALALGVGGFILFGGEREAIRTLVADLQAAAPHPLLIASDLERGAGQQAQGLTQLPPLRGLARLGIDAVREAARITAREARDLGVNFVFAPVVDLDVEASNPIVQTRSFGDDPEEVGALGAAWIQACQAGGVLACAKHYPGHGRTLTDSHADLPVVASSRLTLDADLVPFRMAAAAGVAAMMTAHVAYPALDPSGVPATYSAPIVKDLLRRELGFDGLVVTDALVMEGALQGLDEAQGAVRALQADCDLLLYPNDVARVAHALAEAARGGALDPDLLETAAMRRREAVERLAEPVALGPRDLEADQAQGEAFRVEAVQLLRGALPRAPRAVRVAVVDDDAGGPYPLPPRNAFAKALRARGVGVEEVDAAGGRRAAGALGGPGGGAVPLVVLVFCDVKSWKCRAGLSDENAATVAALAPDAAAVVLFGHARRLADVPGTAPVLCAWTGDVGMQAAAARRLAG
jgi:beta-glucosidase-like glycosyl hydrolase